MRMRGVADHTSDGSVVTAPRRRRPGREALASGHRLGYEPGGGPLCAQVPGFGGPHMSAALLPR